MQADKLRLDQLIQGPSGTVYRVKELRADGTVVVVSSYPQQMHTGQADMILDTPALERFVPFTGDLP